VYYNLHGIFGDFSNFEEKFTNIMSESNTRLEEKLIHIMPGRNI
jgi:hypothetical protein